MEKLLQRLYAVYAMSAFVLLFLIFYIPLLFPILFPARFRWVGIINRWWGRAIFASWFIPVKIDLRSQLDPYKQYIFCPNHFSYIDIPVMALNPMNAIFVGKHDMESIPLFGFMYRKLHITVDRSSLRGRYSTFVRCAEAIDQGKSLVIFPEGGIVSKDIPTMARFKDGPFRLAAEKGIPIVPVTLPDTHDLMPDAPLGLRPGKLHLVFHAPVMAEGADDIAIQQLKNRVFEVIQTELNHVHQRRNIAEDRPLVSA